MRAGPLISCLAVEVRGNLSSVLNGVESALGGAEDGSGRKGNDILDTFMKEGSQALENSFPGFKDLETSCKDFKKDAMGCVKAIVDVAVPILKQRCGTESVNVTASGKRMLAQTETGRDLEGLLQKAEDYLIPKVTKYLPELTKYLPWLESAADQCQPLLSEVNKDILCNCGEALASVVDNSGLQDEGEGSTTPGPATSSEERLRQ